MRELYLPKMGHFNLDAFGGLEALHPENFSDSAKTAAALSHWQAQTLLCGIGVFRGYGIYVPPNNVETLDWNLTPKFQPVSSLPSFVTGRTRFASEIDVIWLDHKHDAIAAAFEVEHSTPVYSGLLRFNDVLLTCPSANRFFVVSNDSRRDLFARQLQRPTFQRSGLSEVASFLDYSNIFDWHKRLIIAAKK
jgi:type II restriction enzyme